MKVPMIATGTATSGMMRRAPVLQEEQHDDRDEEDGLLQCLDDFPDRLAREGRGVVAHVISQVLREARLQLVHLRHDTVGHVERVGVGKLKDGDADAGHAVEVDSRVSLSRDWTRP